MRPRKNIFSDLEISTPVEGRVTLGEKNSKLYTQSDENREIPLYPILCPKIANVLQPSRSIVISSPTIIEKISRMFHETTPPLSPAPPRTVKPIASSTFSWFEKTRQWAIWGLYHSGISNHRPYENLPLPLPLSIPSENTIRCIACHPHRKKLAVALKDHTIHIYELKEEWSETFVLAHQFQKNISCMEWKPLNGTTLAVGTPTGVLIWEGDWVTRYLSCPSVSNVSSIQWSPVDSLLAVGCPHESVIIWDIATEVPTRLHGTPPTSSYLLRWSPNGHYLFQASLSGRFYIWETLSWTYERWDIPLGKLVQSAAWSGDSHYLAYSLDGSSDFFCLIFDYAVPTIEGRLLQRIPLGTIRVSDTGDNSYFCGRISQIEWNPSGDRMMVSFCNPKGNNSAVALFSTTLSPKLKIHPMGFLQVGQDTSTGVQIKFCDHEDGSLSIISGKEGISTMDLLFTRSDTTSHRRSTLFK